MSRAISVKLKLTNKKTGLPLKDPDGKAVEKSITVPNSNPIDQELLFKPGPGGSAGYQGGGGKAARRVG